MKKNIILIISSFILVTLIVILGYLFFQNQKLDDEVNKSKENLTKVEEKINNGKVEKKEKEDEYEKLKEELKEQFEELSIWEEIKEKLNKALS